MEDGIRGFRSGGEDLLVCSAGAAAGVWEKFWSCHGMKDAMRLACPGQYWNLTHSRTAGQGGP